MAGIFLSYRHADVPAAAARIHDRLVAYFGADRVFLDVSSLESGEHFDVALRRVISGCDVLLLIVGPEWEALSPRLQEPGDVVRAELVTALSLERPIIPVRIDGAPMPDAQLLPEEIRNITRSQRCEVRHATFDRDVAALIETLHRKYVRPSRAARRRQLVEGLERAGRPYSWLAPLPRRFGVRGSVPWLLLVLLLSYLPLLAGMYWAAQRQYSAGYLKGENDRTAFYERLHDESVDASLFLHGVVTDASLQAVGGALVTVRNERLNKAKTGETDDDGSYTVDLREIEIGPDQIVELTVEKPTYLRSRHQFAYKQGVVWRSVLRQ
jgi:hypothetical protein